MIITLSHETKKIITLIATLILSISALLYGVNHFITQQTTAEVIIGATGVVAERGIGVYWDITATQKITTISWGTLGAGSTKNVTIYIRNELDAPILLYVDAINWEPLEIFQYLHLNWTFGTNYLKVMRVRQVIITLGVDWNVTTLFTESQDTIDFSFDISIHT